MNFIDPDGTYSNGVSNWIGNNFPGLIAAPLAGTIDFLAGMGSFAVGALTFNGNLMKNGLKDAGFGILSGLGLKEALTEKWVKGTTGGYLPESLKSEMDKIGQSVPSDAGKNGMHAWHAGTNAFMAQRLGPVGAVFVFIGGLFHESPLDWGSFKAEQYFQGTLNHILDSGTDIIANTFGIAMGLTIPRNAALNYAIGFGNHIPGPGDPDPTFGGNGRYKTGHPSHAWGQYPKK